MSVLVKEDNTATVTISTHDTVDPSGGWITARWMTGDGWLMVQTCSGIGARINGATAVELGYALMQLGERVLANKGHGGAECKKVELHGHWSRTHE